MAKKTDQQPNGEMERPTPASPLQQRHSELQAERRALEAELAEIDGRIRSAIDAGDLATLDTLTARKAELPRLFIGASTAETKARHEILNAEDQANVKQLEAAQAECEQVKAKLEKRQQEFETEITALKEQLAEAEGRVNVMYQAIAASRNAGSDRDAGFKKSLAALAGV